jgi:tetratricopeptide (TPR) repeat protein
MEARSGRSDEAARLFAKATSKKRKNRPDGATWQAKALHAKAAGKLDEARQCIEAGVACDPRHIPLYHAWGQLEIGENNVTAARDIYQRGVWASKNERDTASLWTAWALLEERAGDYEQARSYLREALRRDQWAVDVRLTWALLEARAGAYVPARQLFEGAVRIDPTNADVWYAYEEMERAYGTAAAADKVWQRGAAARGEETGAPGTAGLGAVPGGIGSSAYGGVNGASPPKVTPSMASLPTAVLQQAARSAREAMQAAQQQQRANAATSAVEQEYGVNSGPRVTRPQPPTRLGEIRE